MSDEKDIPCQVKGETLIREKFNFIDSFDGPKTIPELCGWVGESHKELLREAFDFLNPSGAAGFEIKGSAPIEGARSLLWETARKILGTDTPNYPQATADCTAFSAKNCTEYLQFYPIANGERAVFKRTFPPYFYGASRVLIGQKRLGYQGGSLGVWQAQAAMKYGALAIDSPQCPSYSGKISDQWGINGPPDDLIPIGQEHLVKNTALIRSWDELVMALLNGYPVSVCSSVGFSMLPDQEGFHERGPQWNHAMTCIGVNNGTIKGKRQYAAILNNWGDVHGNLVDFDSCEPWPKGTLRVQRKDIEDMLAANDSYAYSIFSGFPAQDPGRDKFTFI
jgi:hypothetical protein